MNAQGLSLGQALYQGVLQKFFHHLIECQEIGCRLLEKWVPPGDAISDEFLWYVVWSEKSIETSHIRSGAVE